MCPPPTSASELAAGLKTEKFSRPSDRVPELYAYTSVVSLAKKLRSDRDTFDGALPDLASSLGPSSGWVQLTSVAVRFGTG
jgi:hypothetical protein